MASIGCARVAIFLATGLVGSIGMGWGRAWLRVWGVVGWLGGIVVGGWGGCFGLFWGWFGWVGLGLGRNLRFTILGCRGRTFRRGFSGGRYLLALAFSCLFLNSFSIIVSREFMSGMPY